MALVVSFSGCGTCGGCGPEEEPEPDTRPLDTEPMEPEDDPLAGAADDAEERAVRTAVGRTDEARFVAGDIAAERESTDDGPGGGTPRTVPPDPEGAIPADELQKIFRRNGSAARNCYERQLKTDPSLQGRVVLNLTIGADGSVLRADVQGETLRDEEVNTCIADVVRTWSFPEPEGGAARVRKPFTFKPKK